MRFPIFVLAVADSSCSISVRWQMRANNCSKMISSVLGSLGLTALNDSPHALHLFVELKNEDPPTEKDPATSNAEARAGICNDITNSGFFLLFGMVPIDLQEIYRDRNFTWSWDVFLELHSFDRSQKYEYTNVYRFLEFNVNDLFHCREHVFVCPVKYRYKDKKVISHYVSKEYNVGPFSEPHMAGRFVFAYLTPLSESAIVFLAEEPADVYAEVGFNVELHYLRMRMYMEPAGSDEIDPLCKLISPHSADTSDQHYRLCVAVSRSAYFREEIKYADRAPRDTCVTKKILFTTPEGKKMAGGKPYYERMAPCYYRPLDLYKRDSFFYISRAYGSLQLLVYRPDSSNGKMYLANLSINVSIADELNSFDFVEY